jgi:hypothetical protein
MDAKDIDKVEVEVKRFMQKMKAWKDAVKADKGYLITGHDTRFYSEHPVEAGAVRRASLDLTRILAVFRKPGKMI